MDWMYLLLCVESHDRIAERSLIRLVSFVDYVIVSCRDVDNVPEIFGPADQLIFVCHLLYVTNGSAQLMAHALHGTVARDLRRRYV